MEKIIEKKLTGRTSFHKTWIGWVLYVEFLADYISIDDDKSIYTEELTRWRKATDKDLTSLNLYIHDR